MHVDVFEKVLVVRYGKYVHSTFVSGAHTCIAATHWELGINRARPLRMGYFPFTMSLRHLHVPRGRGTGTARHPMRVRGHRLPISTRFLLPMLPTHRHCHLHELHRRHLREKRTSTLLTTHST